MDEKEKKLIKEQSDNSRRKFMFASAAGVAGLAAGLSLPGSAAGQMNAKKSDKKRVAILVDTETHMMPALAREMV